jgi:hypothetical protein
MIKSKRMRLVGLVACVGDRRMCTQGSGWENKGERPFGRPRRRWENTDKINLQEIGWRGLGWLDLVQHRDVRRVNAVLKLRVPLNAGELLSR